MGKSYEAVHADLAEDMGYVQLKLGRLKITPIGTIEVTGMKPLSAPSTFVQVYNH